MELEIALIKDFIDKIKNCQVISTNYLKKADEIELKIISVLEQHFYIIKHSNGEYAINRQRLKELKNYAFLATKLQLEFKIEKQSTQPDIEKRIIDVFKGMPSKFTFGMLQYELFLILGHETEIIHGDQMTSFINPFKEKAEEKESPIKVGNDHLNENQKDLIAEDKYKVVIEIKENSQTRMALDLLKSKGYKITKTVEV